MNIDEIIKEFSKKNLSKNEITMLLLKSTELLKNGSISADQLKKVNKLYDKRNSEIEAPIKKKEKEKKEYEKWKKKTFGPIKKTILIILGLIILYAIISPNSPNMIDFDDIFKPEVQTR